MRKILSLCCVVVLLVACQPSMHVDSIEAEALPLDSTYDEPSNPYLTVLQPIKSDLDSQMNCVVGHSAMRMWVDVPESPLSNWTADAQREAASAFVGQQVPIGIVNVGGLRCDIPEGDIRLRQVYELMPFDNELVIVSLRGSDLYDLCQNFARVGGQGVSGLRFVMADGKATQIYVQNAPLCADSIYRIATSDYLAEGNDHMEPLRKGEIQQTDLKLRDVFLQKIQSEAAAGRAIDATYEGRIIME